MPPPTPMKPPRAPAIRPQRRGTAIVRMEARTVTQLALTRVDNEGPRSVPFFRADPAMVNLPPIKPSRLLWTLLFLGALLVLVNGTVIYAIQTAHHFLDEELGKRFEATAHTAAPLIQPEQLDALFPGTADSLRADFEATMDAVEAADAVREQWRRLADGAGASNILLLDPDHRVVLALRQSTTMVDRATLDEAAFTRAMIGEAAH